MTINTKFPALKPPPLQFCSGKRPDTNLPKAPRPLKKQHINPYERLMDPSFLFEISEIATPNSGSFGMVHALKDLEKDFEVIQSLSEEEMNKVIKVQIWDEEIYRERNNKEIIRGSFNPKNEIHIHSFLSRENCPFIPKVYSSYIPEVSKNNPFALILEKYDGDLSQINDWKLWIPKIYDIAKSVLSALAFMHKHRIIHGDVKPDNILYRESEKETTFSLTDFGLSVELSEEEQTAEGARYTITYQAPELTITNRSRRASDLFALGQLLFQIATGNKRVFQDKVFSYFQEAYLVNPDDFESSFPAFFEDKNEFKDLLTEIKSNPQIKQEKRENRISAALKKCPVGKKMQTLIENLLQYNPKNRPSAEEALLFLQSNILIR